MVVDLEAMPGGPQAGPSSRPATSIDVTVPVIPLYIPRAPAPIIHYEPSASTDSYSESDISDLYESREFYDSDSRFNPSFDVFPEPPTPTSNIEVGPSEPYPAWLPDRTPLSKEAIEDCFLDLTQKFGFQRDSMRNMYDFLMQQLDSRASRMTPDQALLTLHADYIGGPNANYRKWYFAIRMDQVDAVEQGPDQPLHFSTQRHWLMGGNLGAPLAQSLERWEQNMNSMSHHDRLRHLVLFLLCWGEAAQVRLCPECLCFIFKCADDYYRSPECQNHIEPVPEGLYLRIVVKPLYRMIRDQGYKVVDGKLVSRERDHDRIIGYDDVNQLFWYPSGIARIILNDNRRLMDLPPDRRFMTFDRIDWNRTFFKTYYEKRSFGHLLVNFNRIWVLHLSMYWYYTSYNSPAVYTFHGAQGPTAAMTWSVIALGGAVATFIMILATLAEFSYVRTRWNIWHLAGRLLFLCIMLAITAGPTIYIALHDSPTTTSSVPLILGIVQFCISVVTTILFSIVPLGRIFGGHTTIKSQNYSACQTFTASFPDLDRNSRLASFLLWFLVFGCKFTESYFFLVLSLHNPIQTIVGMKVQNCNDRIFGTTLCSNHIIFTSVFMHLTDLVLFFLDTYVWYLFWNMVYSIARFFMLGLPTPSPRKETFLGLPKKTYSKLLSTSHTEVQSQVSHIWNAIVISMYREHLLSIENVQKLMYHQATSDGNVQNSTLHAPAFFTSHERREKGKFFPHGGEAERRLSFFAQSLSTIGSTSLPVEAMPTFTVLVPHYSEKIFASLRETIGEGGQNTRITLLEYLKALHPFEWNSFVSDSRTLEQASARLDTANLSHLFRPPVEKASDPDDIPLYSVGYKSSLPEFTLRTRTWASLRSQTLYRTVTGMMNYSKAIKLLYRVENSDVVQQITGNPNMLDAELDRMARRKFKLVVSMQRYSRFNSIEHENAELLLRQFPDLQISYIYEEPPRREGEAPRFYFALIDGHSNIEAETGRRRPKYRIELPGNPILGDGKSDNLNHAIIFYRGEYLQLIDANQDNYLEECLKIRNVLAEFEEYSVPHENPYAQRCRQDLKNPVAIVGAREYIFSENIGVLGDLTALKEKTFRLLQARTLSWLGGKLHCNHPDFFNGVFMATRGGLSKAQKSLHLTGDIYAGITALGRGGRLKHVEYYQCGKGRDLGFGTILNFQTKIGSGMGEQILSREYYYLGTQLAIDQFLTFYYGHPGFHVNNVFIIMCVQVLIMTMVFLGTLSKQLSFCQFDAQGQIIVNQGGCYNLKHTLDWIKGVIYSIVVVFTIAFVPLFIQELLERGIQRAILRFAKHFLSFSPIFEVVSTQIYSYAILSNLTFGGARYIATGRGFAIERISFALLYPRFAAPNIYLGMQQLIMLLYITLSFWIPHLVFVWVMALALCLSPFLFNPHQFSFTDFMIDYREYLRWMSRGNYRMHSNSWVGYQHISRSFITGYTKKRLGHPSEKYSGDQRRAPWQAVIFSEIILPTAQAILFTVAYLFVKSFQAVPGKQNRSPLVRLAVISLGLMAWNAAVLLSLVLVSLSSRLYFVRLGAVIAFIAHLLGLVGMVGFFEFLWFLEFLDVSHAALGLLTITSIHRAVYKIITVFLPREFKHDEMNRAWWSGRWYGLSLGSHLGTRFFREFLVKIIELSQWSLDFLLGHILLFMLAPLVLIPYIDLLHTTVLFWLHPSPQIRPPLYSTKQQKQRQHIVIKYGILFLVMLLLFTALIVLPAVFREAIHMDCSLCQML